MALKKNLRELFDGKTPQLDTNEEPTHGWADGDGLSPQERIQLQKDAIWHSARERQAITKGVMVEGTGIRPLRSEEVQEAILARERENDELMEASRQRHLVEAINPTPQTQAPIRYPRRIVTQTTRTEEEMGPTSGMSGSPQGYRDETRKLGGPANPSLPIQYQPTKPQFQPTSQPQAPQPGPTPSSPNTLGAAPSQPISQSGSTAQVPGQYAGRPPILGLKEEIEDEELGTSGGRYDAQTEGRVNPLFGGVSGRMEETFENPDLEKPGWDMSQLDSRNPGLPPAKIAADPGRSGSSGVYRMSFHKLTNLVTKSPRFEKSVDGRHFYINGIVSDTDVDYDKDALTTRALGQMTRALDDQITLFEEHNHTMDSSLGVATRSEIVDMPNGNKGLWAEFRLEDPDKNSKVATLLNKLDTGERIGFSIGASTGDSPSATYMENGIRKLDDVQLMEVSACSLPANARSYVLGTVFKRWN